MMNKFVALEKRDVAYIKHPLSDDLPPTQRIVHCLCRPVMDKEIVCSHIGILGETVKSL